MHRLLLCADRDIPFRGQMSQERFHFLLAHLARMALAVKEDEATNPVNVAFFGVESVLLAAHHLANLVEKSRLLGRAPLRTARHFPEGLLHPAGACPHAGHRNVAQRFSQDFLVQKGEGVASRRLVRQARMFVEG
jgi:hypothetical protein